MHKRFFRLLTAAALATATLPAMAADHLLLSEFGIAPGDQTSNMSSEYVEIFNPTTQPISLDNYWFTDHNWYKNLPTATVVPSFGTSDNLLRFPPGHVLQPGQVAIICGGSTLFYKEFFGEDPNAFASLPGSPLIFQVGDATAGTATQMLHHNSSATPLSFSLTNIGETNGEFGILFYWDGAADLVKDVDIVAWGGVNGTNAFAPKTPADLGANGTPYAQDNGSHTDMAIMNGAIIIRQTINEIDELQTGGNGLTGHDESTENTKSTWLGVAKAQATPGVTDLPTLADNQTPLIHETFHTPQFPSASDAISVVTNVEDFDGSVAQVRVFRSVDGGAYTPVVATADTATTFTANLGTFPAGSVINYYVEATDDDGGVTLLPSTAPTNFQTFLVEQNPVLPGDLVINEILGNNKGGDAYEFVEIHNTTDEEIDLSYYRFADNNRNYFVFPVGTTLAAKGYLILTMDVPNFNTAYPTLPGGTQVFDWGTFGLNNGGDDVVLVHPNAFLYRGETTYLDRVAYTDVDDTPWPVTSPNSTGRTYELLNPALDNSLPESWDGALLSLDPLSTVLPGTPGAQNSVYTVAVVDLFRPVTFPAPSQAIKVDAGLTAPGSATITGVQLFVDTGGTFTPQPMTIETGTTYTATIAGQPDGTVIRYYLEITNSDGETTKWPAEGDLRPLIIKVEANPAQFGDVVINEVLYDNVGGDAYEFIELYNNSGQPIDLGHYRIVTKANYPFIIPPFTVLQPDSYLVLTMNDFNFFAAYGFFPDFTWLDTFNLVNGGDNIRLIHPNQYNPSNRNNEVIDFVNYGVAPPWPDQATEPSNTSGASIELINPNYADRGTNGDRWKFTTNVWDPNISTTVMGTPGQKNSTFSGVSDWTIY